MSAKARRGNQGVASLSNPTKPGACAASALKQCGTPKGHISAYQATALAPCPAPVSAGTSKIPFACLTCLSAAVKTGPGASIIIKSRRRLAKANAKLRQSCHDLQHHLDNLDKALVFVCNNQFVLLLQKEKKGPRRVISVEAALVDPSCDEHFAGTFAQFCFVCFFCFFCFSVLFLTIMSLPLQSFYQHHLKSTTANAEAAHSTAWWFL
jgi:hypothetical protein